MQQHFQTRKTNWGDLPCELLRSIAKNLKKFSDFSNFKSVCKKWYYSLSISVLLPFSDYASHSSTLFSSSILLLHANSSSSSSTPTPWMVSSVEIIKGNMQLLHPFFRTPFPNQIDLDSFHFSVLAQSYHIAPSRNLNCASSLSAVDKVLVFSDRRVPSIDDCSLLVLHNGRLGGYSSSNQEDDPDWVDVSYHGVDDFDDIINFKGLIYAVDWQGKLYQMANDQISVEKTLVSFVISNAGAYNGWRKRLVGSSLDENLYLIVREIDKFKVYMLSNRGKMGVWIKVQSFGDDKQVLFLSRVYGFFGKTSDFPGRQLGNCIVFSDDAFPMYSFRGWVYQMDVQSEEEIKIFRVGVGVGSNFQPILSCSNFPIMLWTLPTWISQAPPGFGSPLDQRNFIGKHNMFPHRNSMGNEMQRDSNKRFGEPERSANARFQVDTETPHVIQPVEKGVSVTPKFEGIDVHTDHLPILEKVWAKHGDVVKGIKLHSSDFLATTLTALAKLILILQTNTGKTLTDDRANYLTSTMSDLLSLGVNVEWLVPFVEKASALHQRNSLEAALLEFEKAKAKVEEMNRNFVAKMAQMSQCKREPQDGIGMLASEIDPDKLVGEGLF